MDFLYLLESKYRVRAYMSRQVLLAMLPWGMSSRINAVRAECCASPSFRWVYLISGGPRDLAGVGRRGAGCATGMSVCYEVNDFSP